MPRHAYVGSRTTAGRGTGSGISRYRITADGAWEDLGSTPAVNPGFLVLDADRRMLHAAHGDGNTISSYSMGGDGDLALRGTQDTGGSNPAHAALSPEGRFVLVANHASGSVASLPVGADGTLGEIASLVEFQGLPGPHRTDQQGSKPHQVAFSPDGSYIVVPDKGLDTLFTLRLDAATGKLRITGAVRLREFSGPRHVVFHPTLPVLFCINELASTVTVVDVGDPEDLQPLQTVTTLDDTDVRDSRAAEVVLSRNGRFLYASNRSGRGDRAPAGPGEDTIACYEVRPNGLLTPRGSTSSKGQRPRFMTVADRILWVANEHSGSLVAFDVRDHDGSLAAPAVVVHTASPVCLVFAEL